MVEVIVKDDGVIDKKLNIFVNEKKQMIEVLDNKKIIIVQSGLNKFFLKARFIKTNDIIIRVDENKKYAIIWRDNFFYLLSFMFVILLSLIFDYKLYQMHYNFSIIFLCIILIMLLIILPLFWNDLIMLGRQITVIEV